MSKPLTTARTTGKPGPTPTPDASDGGALPFQAAAAPPAIRHRKANGKFRPARKA